MTSLPAILDMYAHAIQKADRLEHHDAIVLCCKAGMYLAEHLEATRPHDEPLSDTIVRETQGP